MSTGAVEVGRSVQYTRLLAAGGELATRAGEGLNRKLTILVVFV